MSELLEQLKQLRANIQRSEGDRGAVLPILGIALLILLTSGALAVDASAISDRGQALQNGADAAALAGVAEWSASGNEGDTEAIVADVLGQNGLTSDSNVTWETEFVSASEIRVSVKDSDPDVLLSSAIGLGSDFVERSAGAQFTPCNPTCGSIVDVPKPLLPVNYNGSGDGYRPLLVEGKVYAVRHHDDKIGCVDRTTNAPCWPDIDRDLFSTSSDIYTMNVTNPYLYGSRIYYLGFADSFWARYTEYPSNSGSVRRNGSVYIGCWETKTDTSCGDTYVTANEGRAMLAGTEDGLFVFTNDRKVYCLDPETLSSCSTLYSGGLDTAAASKSSWNPDGISVRNSTFRAHAGKIYTTIAINGRHHLQCWDTGFSTPCSGFGTPEVNDLGGGDHKHDIWYEGRLFFYRNSSGDPQAICSTGRDGADCFDLLSGDPDTSSESALASFVSTWDLPQVKIQSAGQHTYHEASNRTFFLSQTGVNTTYCWDWTSGGSCGELPHPSSPLPYGYWPTTECLFGLGHAKIFFTITPDMTNGCDAGHLRINVDPCVCREELLWPEVTVRNNEEVEEFRVRVLDASGDVIFPTSGSGWLDLANGDELNLADVTTSFDQVTLEVVVVGQLGLDPWADGDFPGLEIVSPGFLPLLIE